MRTTVDGVDFEIGEPFDFSFLSAYGRVFKVFDDQDSGNICFGVENGKERLFIKFAGAVTARGGASPAESMARARRNTQIYRDLRHDDLLNLISCDEVGGGIALVFPWTDAICWGRMYPEQHAQFAALPDHEKCAVYDAVLRFHAHVLACGYVPVDFYDGSVLYDVQAKKHISATLNFIRNSPASIEWDGCGALPALCRRRNLPLARQLMNVPVYLAWAPWHSRCLGAGKIPAAGKTGDSRPGSMRRHTAPYARNAGSAGRRCRNLPMHGTMHKQTD